MPEPKHLNATTPSTLAQLLNIDTQLSVQEAHLSAQLESIQHKRQSLQVVIALFDSTDKTDVAKAIEEKASTPQAQIVEEKDAVSPTNKDNLPSLSPIVPASTQGKKTTKSTSKKKQAKKTQTLKATKQTPGWQQYLREDFRNSSLPQAISSVIHSQPERVWEISTVVETIFVSEIPQEVKKKVRFQITNLLAQGARDNKWYRGQQGSYTLSKERAAAKDS